MSDRAFALIGLIVLTPLFGFLATDGVRTGTVWSQFGQNPRRDEQPIRFWTSVGILAIMSAIALVVSLTMLSRTA